MRQKLREGPTSEYLERRFLRLKGDAVLNMLVRVKVKERKYSPIKIMRAPVLPIELKNILEKTSFFDIKYYQ